jgi:hypothetical protein
MTGGGSPGPLPEDGAAQAGMTPQTARRPRLGIMERLAHGKRAMLRELALAPLWGVLMALSALGYLLLHGRVATGHTGMTLAIFAAGGLLAFPVSAFLSAVLSTGRNADVRFASAFLCLTLFTIAITAILFALQYRLFFSRWHAPFATRIWFYQFAFTGAAALYQFIVMGIRLYMPFGLPALLAMSFWLARRGGEQIGGNGVRR